MLGSPWLSGKLMEGECKPWNSSVLVNDRWKPRDGTGGVSYILRSNYYAAVGVFFSPESFTFLFI